MPLSLVWSKACASSREITFSALVVDERLCVFDACTSEDMDCSLFSDSNKDLKITSFLPLQLEVFLLISGYSLCFYCSKFLINPT